MQGLEMTAIPCPKHAGAYDCTPFCPVCEGNQETQNNRREAKKMNDTKTKLTAWNGETYKGAGELWETFKGGEFAQYTQDLDPDELLRLALFAWNSGVSFVPEDLPALIAEEQELYWGEYESGAEMAQDMTEHTDPLPDGIPAWVVIDWQASWDRNLRHDFFSYYVIDIDGNFRNFFWRAY
jgi:hypothetical protein